MAKQTINIGTAPNDGTGTPLRTAFDYCNLNFTELYTAVGPSGNNIVCPGTLTVSAGTLALPSLTTAGDTNTGIYFPAADTIAFVEGGTEAMRINSTGNLVVNNAATITGDLTAARLIVTGGTIPTNGLWLPTTNTLEFAANSLAQYRIAPLGVFSWFDGAGGTRMTLNSTGLGVGVTPSVGKLEVDVGAGGFGYFRSTTYSNLSITGRSGGAGSGGCQLFLTTTGSRSWLLGQRTDTAYGASNSFFIRDDTAAATRLEIDSAGNVGVGISPSYKLTVQGADNSIIAQLGGTNRQVRLSTSAISAVDNASFNFIHTSGSGRFTFQNNSGTQTMLTIDDNGNNILRMPVTPPTLGVNLEGTFNLTSNTNLRISVRGSDGVTRVTNLTLA